MTGIGWREKGWRLLQTLAFCVVVAAVQQVFMPWQAFTPSLVHSLLIGATIWAVIDIGRHAFPSAAETGWPALLPSLLLVAGAIVFGFVFGNLAANALCSAFGLFPAGSRPRDHDMQKGMIVTLLAGVVGSYWFYTRSTRAYLLRKMREATVHANEARLKLLETQLEPHMLFNTLANLRALIPVDPRRAQQMLDHMIAYLRATLDASLAPTHALDTEFERLHDYLELMAIRMGPRLAYRLELPPEVSSLSVPTLLLQPLIENSIQHGLEPKVEGGRIDVRARRDGDRLLLEVEDTGVGTGAGPSKGKGFGMQQIRERLQALYGGRASFDFAAAEGGTLARIALPIG